MDVVVKANRRNTSGSAEARRMRLKGILPGVMYDEKGVSTPIQLDRHEFDLMLEGHRGDSMMVDVEVDGKPHGKMLLKDVQRHPLSDDVIHVDLSVVSMTETMRFEVGIELKGDPVGVHQQGGVLEQVLRSVEVECLPGDLVESFELDVSALEIGDSLSAGDLALDSRFSLVTDPEIAVAAVSAPRVEEEPEEAEADEAGAEEPERIGEDKEDTQDKAED